MSLDDIFVVTGYGEYKWGMKLLCATLSIMSMWILSVIITFVYELIGSGGFVEAAMIISIFGRWLILFGLVGAIILAIWLSTVVARNIPRWIK